MARPLKSGLDYFPLDVHLDDEIELIEADYGLEGFAIVIKLWQKIYSEGYYISWSHDKSLLFSRKIVANVNTIDKIIDTCLDRGILNKNLYNKYSILTSSGIQKRYFIAGKQSKRKNLTIIKEYNLMSEAFNEYFSTEIELTTEETELTPEEIKITTEESTQSKGEESRVNKSKLKERIYAQTLSMSEAEYEKLISRYGKEIVDEKIEYAENYKLLTTKYTSLYLTLNNWLKADILKENESKKTSKPKKNHQQREHDDAYYEKLYAN